MRLGSVFSQVGSGVSGREYLFWALCTGIALAAGIYFRTVGLGSWPFATDEYYLFRAIEFVTGNGLAAFPCGGYYPRGLLNQYLTAPLLMAGMQPELALRLISVAGSLAVLPAVVLLAMRLGGARAAFAAAIIVLLSTWAVEMARFGRMYTAFQALFVWYAYHAYRLLADGDETRWRWLLPISAVAVFVWEGGVVLALANLLIFFFRNATWRVSHLLASIAIALYSIAFLLVDFRALGATGSGPEPDSAPETSSALLAEAIPLPVFDVLTSPVAIALWLLAAVAVFVSILRGGNWVADWRGHAALGAVALAVLGGQLLLAAMLFVGAILAGWLSLGDCLRRDRMPTLLLLGAVCATWVVRAALQFIDTGSTQPIKALISFPELLYSLIYPWLATIPEMGLMFGAGTIVALLLVATERQPDWGVRYLLALLLLAVLIIGGANTLYSETRYSFHLYPLLLVLTLYGVHHLAAMAFRRSTVPAALVSAAAVAVFLFSADFSPKHLTTVDAYESNFRVGYADRRTRHYFPRFDFGSPSDYVNARASGGDTIIVTNVVLAHYVETPGFIYLDETDPRFGGQACVGLQRERWSDLSLLKSRQGLESLLTGVSHAPVWVVADWQTLRKALPDSYLTAELGLNRVFDSPDNRMAVFHRSGTTGPE